MPPLAWGLAPTVDEMKPPYLIGGRGCEEMRFETCNRAMQSPFAMLRLHRLHAMRGTQDAWFR
jgi:hypothetical protein